MHRYAKPSTHDSRNTQSSWWDEHSKSLATRAGIELEMDIEMDER